MSERKPAKVDPELARQIVQAEEARATVQAVIALRGPGGDRRHLSPEETEATVRRIVGRIAEEIRESPRALNVFRNIGSFVIEADAVFIRRLIDCTEVNSAMANRQPEDAAEPAQPGRERAEARQAKRKRG